MDNKNFNQEQNQLFEIFKKLNIDTKTYFHEPLFTVEQALRVTSSIPGVGCKNLFLKDSKCNLFLIVAVHDTKIDLKKLSKYLKAPELRFANAELLKECLSLEPGSVTPFGIIADKDHKIFVLLDSRLFDNELVSFHPLKNNSTTTIKPNDLIKFIEYCGNKFENINFQDLSLA